MTDLFRPAATHPTQPLPVDHPAPTGSPHPLPPPLPGGFDRAAHPAPAGGTGTPSGGSHGPHDGRQGAPETAPRPRRSPGWTGVIAVGAGAAVLSSLLTAGLMGTGRTTTATARPAATSASAPAAVAASTANAPDWAAVARTVEPSVVAIKIGRGGRTAGEGSGVVFDASGHVVTNNHVVSGVPGASIAVVLADGRTYPATVVGADPSADLAVLRITDPPADLKAATFADSATVAVGQPVMAVGNPLGLADTATTGIVSAVDRPVTTGSGQGQGGGERVVTNAIQTDAAINPGNSGGALVDAAGSVIGITSSIASLGSAGGQSGSIGLGFAIPSSTARSIAEQIIDTGTATHAYLGVTPGDTEVAVDGATRQAAAITNVGENTPAAQAGLTAGDAVVALDGRPVESADSLVARVRSLAPGTKVTLTVAADGATREVEVTLAERPASG